MSADIGGWIETIVAGGIGTAISQFLGLDVGDYKKAAIILGTILLVAALVVFVIFRTIMIEVREYRQRASDYNRGLNESFDRITSRARGRFKRSDEPPAHRDLVDPPLRKRFGTDDREER